MGWFIGKVYLIALLSVSHSSPTVITHILNPRYPLPCRNLFLPSTPIDS